MVNLAINVVHEGGGYPHGPTVNLWLVAAVFLVIGFTGITLYYKPWRK